MQEDAHTRQCHVMDLACGGLSKWNAPMHITLTRLSPSPPGKRAPAGRGDALLDSVWQWHFATPRRWYAWYAAFTPVYVPCGMHDAVRRV